MRNVFKAFPGVDVLNGISLSVRSGEVAAVIGRSGSGKSTLLRCINLLVPPDSGDISILGKRLAGGRAEPGGSVRSGELRRIRARAPMVFQRFNLFQHKTALGNVTLAQTAVLKRSRQEAEHRAIEALTRVGLRHKANAYPIQLSGGEQQRVGIARALAMDPAVILFDEPTSSLDPELVGSVLDVIRQLAADDLTMIIVTHEMRFARLIADHVVFVDGGVIAEEGSPAALFDNPRTPELKSFIEAILR